MEEKKYNPIYLGVDLKHNIDNSAYISFLKILEEKFSNRYDVVLSGYFNEEKVIFPLTMFDEVRSAFNALIKERHLTLITVIIGGLTKRVSVIRRSPMHDPTTGGIAIDFDEEFLYILDPTSSALSIKYRNLILTPNTVTIEQLRQTIKYKDPHSLWADGKYDLPFHKILFTCLRLGLISDPKVANELLALTRNPLKIL